MNYGWITTRALVCLGIALMLPVSAARAQQDVYDEAALTEEAELAEEAEFAPDEDPSLAYEEVAPAEELEPAPSEVPEPAPTPEPRRPSVPRQTPPSASQPPLRPERTGQPRQVSPDDLTPTGREVPAIPVDPYRPKSSTPAGTTRGGADEPLLTLDFEEDSLLDVIKIIGAQTGKNFDIDPQMAQMKVTLISHAPIPASMAFDILGSLLQMRGYDMVEVLDGHLVRIVQTGQFTEKSPLVIGRADPKGFDMIATHIVPILYANAADLQSLLQQLGSQTAAVSVYEKTNMLIITDTADGIRNMLAFIQEIDVPGYETEMEIFTLEYTRAEVLATQIQDILGVTPEGAPQPVERAARPTPVPRQPARPNVPGRPESTVVSHKETMRIVSDERLNALIVLASAPLMGQVRDLISLLDTPTDYESDNLHVYQLLNADATKVEEALNAVIGLTPRAEGQQQGAPAATAEIQPFEKKVQITSYEDRNSLLIVAAPQDYRVIRELIAQLDVPPRQVHVDAVIMEVTISDNFDLSVELASIDGSDGFGLNNVVTLATVLTEGPLAAVGNGGVLAGIIDGTTDLTFPDGAGGFITQKIPNIPLLMQTLEAITEVDVLAQPGLTTKDNVEAEVVVGQEVPFITGSSRSLDQSAIGSSVFSRVEREDVGIKLKVKPQISEGDYVSMELEVEVSEVIQSTVGADVNIVGPTLSKSNVKTETVIKDGSTGILGGLLREGTDRSIRQPPYLGDLPMVGWLFRTKSNQRSKRNLVLLVSPYIIKEGIDMDRVTKYRMDQFSHANVDVLFEKGYIKRINKRRYMRNEHRPTRARVGQINAGERFGRGDARRGTE
ncbi:MAG: type II secretion system secretin GspD [Candidatus Hydrogenedentales bacterium]